MMTRLAKDYDAISNPASGRLLFVPQGLGESASGQTMSVVRIPREHVKDWRLTFAGRGESCSVRAHWREAESTERIPATAGSMGPVYVLKRLYASEPKRSRLHWRSLPPCRGERASSPLRLAAATPCLEQRRS